MRPWRSAAIVLCSLAIAGCHRPAASPGDPMLDAVRAEARAADLTYIESQGNHLFKQYCASCHGDEARGDGQNASNLTPRPPDLTVGARDQTFIRKVIMEGSGSVGRSALSPPWGRSLSTQEITYLVAYCQAVGRKKP
jgi:mono/diheme cytochrome c family protein